MLGCLITSTIFCPYSMYILCLSLNLTFANKNLGLNILHGFSRGAIWVQVNLYTFRSIVVVVAADALTLAKSSDLRTSHQINNYIFSLLNVPIEVLVFVIPIKFPNVSQTTMCSITTICLTILNMIPHFYFTRKLRNIVASIPVSRDFYDPIQKKLDNIFIVQLLGTIVTDILILFWIIIPAIHENLYILYSIHMLIAPFTGFQNLWFTRESQTNVIGNKSESKFLQSQNQDHDRATTRMTRSGSALNLTLDIVPPSPISIQDDSQRPLTLSSPESSNPTTPELVSLTLRGEENTLIFNPFNAITSNTTNVEEIARPTPLTN